MGVLYSRKDEAWKLADFGYATQLNSRSRLATASARGTDGYFAPEFFSDGDALYDTKVDIWSLGCILYELAMGKNAFSSNSAIFEYKSSGRPPIITSDESFSQQCEIDINTCLSNMLKVDPAQRPSATDLTKSFVTYQKAQFPSNAGVRIRHEFQQSLAPSTASHPLDPSKTVVLLPRAVRDFKPDLSMVLSAIENDPRNYWSWRALVYLFYQRKDIHGAIDACEAGHKKDAFNPAPLIELTNLYAALPDSFGMAIDVGLRLCGLQKAEIRKSLAHPEDSPAPTVIDYFVDLLETFQA
jgi:serine/threonine protein kinase